MKKLFLFIVLLFLAFLPTLNTTFASCQRIYYGNGKEEIIKNKNKGLILTKENILDMCTISHNEGSDNILLNCSNRGITKVDSNTFSALTGVKTINLSCNYLTGFKAGTFNNLAELKELDLGDNNINYLNKLNLNGLTNINNLHLDGNLISKIQPGTFAKLKNLEDLNLNNNQITKFSSGTFFGLEHLSYLTVSSNFIKSIEPGTFSNLKNLNELNISLPSNITTGIFAGLNNLNSLRIYLNNENPDDIDIQEGLFSGLNNITSLTMIGSGNRINSLKLNYPGLKNLSKLYFHKIEFNRIESGTFSRLLNLKELGIRSTEIEPGAFNNLNNLEQLYLGTSGDIKDGTFDGLNNLRILSLHTEGSIGKRSFIPLKNLKHIDLTINHKNDISKGMFSNLKSLDEFAISINEQMNSNSHNGFGRIIQIIQACLYYDYLGIIDAFPDKGILTMYTRFKFGLIGITIFIFMLMLINKHLKKKRGVGIIFSYFTMRKFSKYLSHTKKRWRHIMIKTILRLILLAPLGLELFMILVNYDYIQIYYQVTDSLENRYTDDVVSKETLVFEGETPGYSKNEKIFKQNYKVEIFDGYSTYWCSNSWDVTKLKALEEQRGKPYTLDNSYKEEFYETFLNNMRKDNVKCIEDQKFGDILKYKSWDTGYTHVGKITFLSLLMTIVERLLYIGIPLLMGWILRYILMFFYYNIVLFFIKRTPGDNSNLDKISNELSSIDIELLDDEIKKIQ